ncbi:MAG: putative Ig domain-containing protein [Nitrospiraceae bacterium]
MRRKKTRSVLKAVSVVAICGGLAACGGGGDSGTPATPPTVTSKSLFFDVGQPAASGIKLEATGTGPFTWKSDALPAGLFLSETGEITGTPSVGGQKTVKVTATGPGGTDDESVVVTVLGRTSMVSVSSTGEQSSGGDSGNGIRFINNTNQRRSSFPGISADGRFVVFDSTAPNFGANNGKRQIYRRDRVKGETILISQSSSGVAGNDDSHVASVSQDGRFVAWDSFASNLDSTDSADITRDVFLRDTVTGKTERISQRANGSRPCQTTVGELCNSFGPTMSADGSLIVFGSFASLVSGDEQADEPKGDLYLYQRDTKILKLITKGIGGASNGISGGQQISPDGKFVVFQSRASNLVENDPDQTDLYNDIFVYNVATEKVTKISVAEADPTVSPVGASENPTISDNGSRIAFAAVDANGIKIGDANNVRDIIIVDWSGDGSVPTNYRRVTYGAGSGDLDADSPSISRDGQYLTFHRGTVEPDGLSGDRRVHVMRVGSAPQIVSADSNGVPADADSRFPRISADGRYVTYYSGAGNLVQPDNNGAIDAFITQRSLVVPN